MKFRLFIKFSRINRAVGVFFCFNEKSGKVRHPQKGTLKRRREAYKPARDPLMKLKRL